MKKVRLLSAALIAGGLCIANANAATYWDVDDYFTPFAAVFGNFLAPGVGSTSGIFDIVNAADDAVEVALSEPDEVVIIGFPPYPLTEGDVYGSVDTRTDPLNQEWFNSEDPTSPDKAGFDSVNETVTSAMATFWFGFPLEDISVEVDLSETVNGPIGKEFITVLAFDTGTSTATLDLTTVLQNVDGTGTSIIDYTVSVETGDSGVFFDYARLLVTTEPRGGQNVPDSGSTLLLSGCALLGLSAVRRKLV